VNIEQQIDWCERMIAIGADTHATPKMQAILASLRRLQAIEGVGMPEYPEAYDQHGNVSESGGVVFTDDYDALRLYAERQALRVAELEDALRELFTLVM